jgi:hypothetical protein
MQELLKLTYLSSRSNFLTNTLPVLNALCKTQHFALVCTLALRFLFNWLLIIRTNSLLFAVLPHFLIE